MLSAVRRFSHKLSIASARDSGRGRRHQAGHAGVHKFQGASGIRAGDQRFRRQHGLQRDVAVIFIERRKQHSQRPRVALDLLLFRNQPQPLRALLHAPPPRQGAQLFQVARLVGRAGKADHHRLARQGQGLDYQLLALGEVQAAGKEQVVLLAGAVEPGGLRGRIVERLGRNAAVLLQAPGDVLRDGRYHPRFRNQLMVGLADGLAHLLALGVQVQVRHGMPPQVVSAAVLVHDPQRLAGMRNVISRELQPDQQIDAGAAGLRQIQQAAGQHGIQNPLGRIPLERNQNLSAWWPAASSAFRRPSASTSAPPRTKGTWVVAMRIRMA